MRAVPIIKDLIRDHKPDVLFLFETLVIAKKIDALRMRLGFDGGLGVDHVGRGGGVAVLWRNSTAFSIMSYSANFINLEMVDGERGNWRLTGFYGYPQSGRRRASWELLRTLSNLSPLPWCVVGDFNNLLNMEDKRGRMERSSWMLRGFRETVQACGLTDLNLKGYPYTWVKSRGSEREVEERLDRAMASSSWMQAFPNPRLVNTLAPLSDHML